MSLAEAFITMQGGPAAAARWLKLETGMDYTRIQVTAFRTRGLPKVLQLIAAKYVIGKVACEPCRVKILETMT